MSVKTNEGQDAIRQIHSNSAINYAIFYVKRGKRRSILKFQESGAGGLAEVRAGLNESKVQFFLFRVTGIDVKAGAKSIRSKFVRGCYTGASVSTMDRANAGGIQSEIFQFLQDAHKSYQISSLDELTEETIERDLRAAAGAHQVQRFDFANAEARISKKSKTSAASPKPKPAAASPAPVAAASPPAAAASSAAADATEDSDAASETSTETLKLVYFPLHGRGEAIRLILKAGGVDFVDERVTDWGAIKGDPDSAPSQLFGTLPIITHGDFKIGQSRAVQTYAAKIALPSTCATPKASAIDAMFQNAHADVQTEMFKCVFGPDEAKEAAAASIDDNVAKPMAAIEKNLPDDGFIKGGDIPSAADIVMFDLAASSCNLKGLGVDVSKYPKFNKLAAAVGAYPPIAAYVAERE